MVDHTVSRRTADSGQLCIAENFQHVGTCIQRKSYKTLHTCMHSFGIGIVRPVKELAGHLLDTVFIDERCDVSHELGQIFFLFRKVGLVAVCHVPFLVEQNPPQRIRRHTVHPFGGDFGDRRFFSCEIERLRNDIVVAECGNDGHNLGMHIADPDKTVALDAVPQVFLHVQMRGVGCRVPDLVEQRIGAVKGALVFDIAEDKDRVDALEGNRGFLTEQVDACEAETGFVGFHGGVRAEIHDEIAVGVVVGGVLDTEIGHRFHDGFAQTDADIGTTGIVRGARILRGLGTPDHQTECAVDFHTEVKKDGCLGLAGLVCHDTAVGLVSVECDLFALGGEQIFHAGDFRTFIKRRPDDASWCQITAGAFIGVLAVEDREFIVDSCHDRLSFLILPRQ